jgi:formate hydrogenlyase subunit 6/NADH:ubiquinone oxidoreductase subunit I
MERMVVLANRHAVEPLRTAIARERALFEVRRVGQSSEWCHALASEPFDWEAPLPLTGAKRFFFPPREPLLSWHGDTAEETLPDPRPFALFGVRPCDLAGISYQDRFFNGDLWYARRRARVLLVGINCLRACPGGFCRDVDAGPFASGGFDLNLTPLSDGRVIVECGTAAGHAALQGAAIAASENDAATTDTLAKAAASAVASFPDRPFIARALARMNASSVSGRRASRPATRDRRVSDAEWAALGPSCFACTGCTNVCPTCSCFTIVDETRDGDGERVRCWDSCLLEGFQREASGHHPAPRPADRVRRFWYHKLSSDFVPADGRLGCVGCGRCDVTCPGSIGALRVLHTLGAA